MEADLPAPSTMEVESAVTVDTRGEGVPVSPETDERAAVAPSPAPRAHASVLQWFFWIWLVGVALLSAWHAAAWALSQMLRRRGVTPSDDVLALVGRIARRLRIRRAVVVRQTLKAAAPMVIGWLKPALVLPASILTGLTPSELEAVLAHELAHVRRHDYLVNLVQTVVETLLFYHPGVWWLSCRIRSEREFCADDLAMSVCQRRDVYARSLLALAEMVRAPSHRAVAATGGHFLTRIRRIVHLSDQRSPTRQFARHSAVVAVMATACLGIVLIAIGQSEPPKNRPSSSDIEVTTDVEDVVESSENQEAAKSVPQRATDLAPPVRIMAGGAPIDVDGAAAPFLADFDEDGTNDLLIGQAGYGRLRIYRNTGTNARPKFDSFEWFMADGRIAAVPVACYVSFTPQLVDFDGDGRTDVVTGSGYGYGGAIYLFRRRDDGTFAAGEVLENKHGEVALGRAFRAGRPPSRPIAGNVTALVHDWDDDGDGDLVLGKGNRCLVPNEGTRNQPIFGDAMPIMVDGEPIHYGVANPCVADWDGDGRDDLLAGLRGDIVWYRNAGTKGQPVFEAPRILVSRTGGLKGSKPLGQIPAHPFAICAADFNGDGRLDLLLGDHYIVKRSLSEEQQTDLAETVEQGRAIRSECRDLIKQRPKDESREERIARFRKALAKWQELETLPWVGGLHGGGPDSEQHGHVWLFERIDVERAGQAKIESPNESQSKGSSLDIRLIDPATEKPFSYGSVELTRTDDAYSEVERFLTIAPADLPEGCKLSKPGGGALLTPKGVVLDKKRIAHVATFFGIVDALQLKEVQAAVTVVYEEAGARKGMEIGVYALSFSDGEAGKRLADRFARIPARDGKSPVFIGKGNLVLFLWRDEGVSDSAFAQLCEYYRTTEFSWPKPAEAGTGHRQETESRNNRLDDRGFALLHRAASGGNVGRVTELLESGADVNVRQAKFQGTPLQYAATWGRTEVVRVLLDHQAKIDAADIHGRTPLMWAAMEGKTETVRLLLDRDANVNASAKGGWTPLHYAADRRHAETAQLLIDRGADAAARNSLGKTPRELSRDLKLSWPASATFGKTENVPDAKRPTLLSDKPAESEASGANRGQGQKTSVGQTRQKPRPPAPREFAGLPDYVSTTLRWLPADTETLIVAKDFVLLDSQPQARKRLGPARTGRVLAVWPLPDPIKDALAQQRVRWAIHGGRNYEVVSAFGSLRQEGASLIRFDNELSEKRLQELGEQLRIASKDVRSMSGHDVYVFPPDRSSMEGEPKPWQGQYVVFPNAATMVTAFSDGYLDQLLKRMQADPADSALPLNLPEWRYVDTNADVWLLRHLPEQDDRIRRLLPDAKRRLSGLVWMANAGNSKPFRAVYLPLPGKNVEDIAQAPWNDPTKKEIPDELAGLIGFTTDTDGVVTMTFPRAAHTPAERERLRKLAQQLQESDVKSRLLFYYLFYLGSSQGMLR